jgi:superfamily I DNA/RNA helicase
MLSENYRSHQHIIDAAEHIVRAAPAIPGKKAKASGAPATWCRSRCWSVMMQAMAACLMEHYRRVIRY